MSWDALAAATGPADPHPGATDTTGHADATEPADTAGADSVRIASDAGAQPAWIAAAARRLRARLPAADRWRLEALGLLATDRALLYGFDGGARRDVDLRLTGERTWGRTTVSLAVGYRDDSDGAGQVVLDGSYVSQGLGNWVVYAGAAERGYGPGLDAGLVLSRNARPVPGAGVFRDVPRRSHHVLLRWMGPWRVDAFLGVLGGPRTDFRDPLFLNLHWSLQPWPRLDLGFTRGIVLCGEGRPCGADIWLRALFGVFDLDNSGHEEDASNQTASVSLAYTFPVGAGRFTPYTEFYLEDEIEYFSVVAGGRAAGPLGRAGAAWRARAEYCDTYANRSFGSGNPDLFPVRPGVTYNHHVYTGGYTYRDDWLGHPLGDDARLYTLAGGAVSAAGRSLDLRLRLGEARTNPFQGEPAAFRDFHGVEILGETPLGAHRLGARLRWYDRDPFAPDGDPVWEAELGARLPVTF